MRMRWGKRRRSRRDAKKEETQKQVVLTEKIF